MAEHLWATPFPQALVQHFVWGTAPSPTFPFGLGRPRAGTPSQQRPTVPPRENGLWIEGDKLDFMTLTARGARASRSHYSLQQTRREGRRAGGRCFSFPYFK